MSHYKKSHLVFIIALTMSVIGWAPGLLAAKGRIHFRGIITERSCTTDKVKDAVSISCPGKAAKQFVASSHTSYIMKDNVKMVSLRLMSPDKAIVDTYYK